jgi:hypothetical protein
MASSEEAGKIEKVRQEIMRFKELLGVMRGNLEDGERTYAKLFADFSAEEMAGTKEKDLQWKLAERMVDDVSVLGTSAGQMRFRARNLERAFEELQDIIAATHTTE